MLFFHNIYTNSMHLMVNLTQVSGTGFETGYISKVKVGTGIRNSNYLMNL